MTYNGDRDEDDDGGNEIGFDFSWQKARGARVDCQLLCGFLQAARRKHWDEPHPDAEAFNCDNLTRTGQTCHCHLLHPPFRHSSRYSSRRTDMI